MATIGLDKLFYAPITEDENEEETYGNSGAACKSDFCGVVCRTCRSSAVCG